MIRIFKWLVWLISAIILYFAMIMILGMITDFNPPEKLIKEKNDVQELTPEEPVDLMIWNIGYCGLDASMDFFYDGGEQVRPPKENVIKNLEAVLNFLDKNDSVELFLLQEVDINSRRSYKFNQYDSIQTLKKDYYSYLGINYKVFFVPLPVLHPMGKVMSGLQTLSLFKPSVVERYSFPGNYSWPKSLFMLDRCFLVNHYPMANDKELLVINTHNSAYDDGSLRAMQMEYLKKYLMQEYTKGNYIIVGGDWNQSPPGIPKEFEDQKFDDQNYSEIPGNFLPPGWRWGWDGSNPTNRRVGKIYARGNTPTTLIDFFLVSPNVEIEGVKGIDLDFQHSDHQPVAIKISLKENS